MWDGNVVRTIVYQFGRAILLVIERKLQNFTRGEQNSNSSLLEQYDWCVMLWFTLASSFISIYGHGLFRIWFESWPKFLKDFLLRKGSILTFILIHLSVSYVCPFCQLDWFLVVHALFIQWAIYVVHFVNEIWTNKKVNSISSASFS